MIQQTLLNIGILFTLFVISAAGIGNREPQFTIQVIKKQMNQMLKQVSEIEKSSRNCQAAGQNYTSRPSIELPITLFRDCNEIYKSGYTQSGVYMIHFFLGFDSIPIYCDMQTTGAFSGKRGWMTVQRRINGEVDFDRSWTDYLEGFGFPHKEHWIGLRKIYRLINQHKISTQHVDKPAIRIDVEDWDGISGYMEHSSFSLLPEQYDYEIETLGKYNGSSGLASHLGFSTSLPFSTRDHNKDRLRDETCLKKQKGGWWFGFCNHINLNGVYSKEKEIMKREKIFIRNWGAINPENTAFKHVTIKLQFH